VKHQTPESMKFRKLQRRLGVSRAVVVGTLELLWIATQKNAPRGDIGKYTDEEIAIECDWEDEPEILVSALVDYGWLDRCNTYRLVIHDWESHAPGWIRRQLARSKQSFVTVLGGKTVTNDQVLVTDDRFEATPNLTKPNPTEPNQTKPNKLMSSEDDGIDSPVEIFFERFNENAPAAGIAKARKLTAERRKKITTRLAAENWEWEFWEALKKLPIAGGDGWQPDLDWFVANDSNVSKILEGKYDWRTRARGDPKGNIATASRLLSELEDDDE